MERLRTVIRRWLGIEEIYARLAASEATFTARLDEQAREMAASRLRKRDTAGVPMVPASWEEIQAAYAADPTNYKEMA